MKLNRKQELALINLGMQQLLKTLEGGSGNHIHHTGGQRTAWNKGLKGGKSMKWTAARRKKFSETMKKKWANRDTK